MNKTIGSIVIGAGIAGLVFLTILITAAKLAIPIFGLVCFSVIIAGLSIISEVYGSETMGA